jgi:zinc resistance-associated protein
MEEIRSMKTALSAIALATALTLAPFIGGSFAVADDSAQRGEEHGGRFSPEDRAAFLDARIAALKAGLELNAEQEKNWAPLESAMRDLARQRAERFAAWRERGDDNQDGEISPIDRLARASERLSARAADLQKLAAAAKPLYDSLDDGQKRRFAVLFRGSMGRGQGRHWRRDG